MTLPVLTFTINGRAFEDSPEDTQHSHDGKHKHRFALDVQTDDAGAVLAVYYTYARTSNFTITDAGVPRPPRPPVNLLEANPGHANIAPDPVAARAKMNVVARDVYAKRNGGTK